MPLTMKEVSLLRALYFLDQPTRSEIATYTGLSAVSVTAVLNRLMEAGIAHRSGKTGSGSGRPSTIYRISPDVGCTLGVSIETGSFHVVATDISHRIIARRSRELVLTSVTDDHVTDIVRQVSAELERLLADEELADRRILAIGVSPPGMVDTERGVWLHGMRVSGVAHYNLRDAVASTFDVPVAVEDTARCIAWLQRYRGRAEEPLVLLYLGEGVGAGIVMDGRLYRGSTGMAGEIGHMHVAEEGDRCQCGNVGCLEMVVSVPAILRRIRRRLDEGVLSKLQRSPADGLDLERILEAARADDRLACTTLYDLGLVIGDACATLVELYNPRTLLIGGPGSAAGEFFGDPVGLRLRQRLIPEMLAGLKLEFAPYQAEDEALGAAMIAEQRFWQQLDLTAARRLALPAREGHR
jgi:predicted NBD/HSP70 family sugar kinase